LFNLPNSITASERARWFAEMAAALDRALEILPEIIMASQHRPAILELYARLEAARAELKSLRHGSERGEIGPDWTQFGQNAVHPE
jgi:hypothetical protein